jgi:hypothetical protein
MEPRIFANPPQARLAEDFSSIPIITGTLHSRISGFARMSLLIYTLGDLYHILSGCTCPCSYACQHSVIYIVPSGYRV